MKELKRALGLTVEISSGRTDGIRKLEIRVREFNVYNAAEELNLAIERGDESDQQFRLKRANAVQKAADEMRYFQHLSSSGGELLFTWLDDAKTIGQWFGGSVSLNNANEDCFNMLARIVKSVGHGVEVGPRGLIEGLRMKLGALAMQYLPGEYVFVRDPHFDLDAEIPPFELPSEPDVTAERDPEAEALLENPEAAEAA